MQYTLASSNPEGCPGFSPNAFKRHSCAHCMRPWLHHSAVSDADALAALTSQDDGVAQEIIPGLFLGGFKAAINGRFLHDNNISAVVTVARTLEKFLPKFGSGMAKVIEQKIIADNQHIVVDADDSHEQRIDAFVHEGVEHLARLRAQSPPARVLVHCAQGRSRSTTVLVAFLVHSGHSPTVDAALAHIQAKRPLAQPNDSFMAQLKQTFV